MTVKIGPGKILVQFWISTISFLPQIKQVLHTLAQYLDTITAGGHQTAISEELV